MGTQNHTNTGCKAVIQNSDSNCKFVDYWYKTVSTVTCLFRNRVLKLNNLATKVIKKFQIVNVAETTVTITELNEGTLNSLMKLQFYEQGMIIVDQVIQHFS